MKLTNEEVKRFEQEQKEHGTEAAIYSLILKIALEMLNDLGIGIKSIKITEIP